MALLVRKIARGKWPQDCGSFNLSTLSADAISGDLRTQYNKLSTWEIVNEGRLNDAVLALVSAQEKIETMHIITLECNDVARQLTIVNTNGNTPIDDLVQTHKDVSDLNYASLGVFASFVVDALKRNKYKRFSAADLRQLVKEAIQNGRLDIGKVNEKLKLDIEKSIDLTA